MEAHAWQEEPAARGLLRELRAALWLSLLCAVTAALVAVPASMTEFLVDDMFIEHFGSGVVRTFGLRDAAVVERREINFDRSTSSARWQTALESLWSQTVVLSSFPICYLAYLGMSLQASCLTLGSAMLTFATASTAFVATGSVVWMNYSAVLGFALLVAALRFMCPRGSTIPRQALKQALVVMAGNALVMNVIAETTVRRSRATPAPCSLAR
jgi:hypothetical protein